MAKSNANFSRLIKHEAEYMAASAATQEALWQARLLHTQQLGMRIKLPITLYEDNKSAIMFADHPGDHRTTKHIDTRTMVILKIC